MDRFFAITLSHKDVAMMKQVVTHSLYARYGLAAQRLAPAQFKGSLCHSRLMSDDAVLFALHGILTEKFTKGTHALAAKSASIFCGTAE